MFQAYYDFDNKILIDSKNAEATINCYAQEINLIEVRKLLDEEEKKKHPIKYWIKRLFKRGRK